MEKTGNEKLIEQLLIDGCYYMFGNPGTVEQGLLDAITKYKDFHYINCLQESIAVAMADGYARASKRAAIVQLHSGVGLGNGIGMLYQAKRGHSPIVVLAGEAGIKYDALDGQMACDLVEMTREVTKWSGRVLHKDSVLRLVRRAIKIASTPPMGPVFLALPLDIMDEINTESIFPSVHIQTNTIPTDDSVIEKVTDLLINANNPIFLIGDGIGDSSGACEVEELAQLIGARVYGVNTSQVNIRQDFLLYEGDLGHMFGKSSREKVKDADVVFVAGTYLFPEVFPNIENPFQQNVKIIHIDLDAYEIGKNYGVSIGIVANPRDTISKVIQQVKEKQTKKQKDMVAQRWRDIRKQKEKNFLAKEGLVEKFCKEIIQMRKKELIVFDEALTSSDVLSQVFKFQCEGSFYQTRGGSLGVGIPGAIGIKLVMPEKTVIGFTGDGGSMYTIQALYTAARYKIGAKFVILNNGDYKLLKNNIDVYWKEKGIASHEYPDCFSLYPKIDFIKLSEAMGVKALRVDRQEKVKKAVEWLLKDEQPALIELVFDNGKGKERYENEAFKK